MKRFIVMAMALILILTGMSAGAEKPSGALIIYFDYSENINTEGLDADAVSSASIAEGMGIRERSNLLVMVDLMKERTGAPAYALHIREAYAPIYMDMVGKAQDDKNNDV